MPSRRSAKVAIVDCGSSKVPDIARVLAGLGTDPFVVQASELAALLSDLPAAIIISGNPTLIRDTGTRFLADFEPLQDLAMPDIWPGTLAVNSVVASFLRQLMALITPPWRAIDPNSKRFLGIGAFNMVRREAFEATQGFDWLRMEVADDMGVAMMMKRSGAKAGVIAAFGDVGLHWYRTLDEVRRGAEKAYATTGCRFVPMVLGTLIGMALEVSPVAAPLAAVLLGWPAAGIALGASVAAVFLAASSSLTLWARVRLCPGLLTPLTAPFSAAIMLWSALAGLKRGGIVWRQTLYPSADLRAGRRLRLF